MIRTSLLVLAVCLFCTARASAQQGKLDQVRDAVKDEHGSGDESHESQEDEDWLDDDDEGWFDEFFVDVLLAPFCCPRWALGDQGFGDVPFERYPHASGKGYWITEPEVRAEARRWAVRVALEQGSDFDDLERTGVGVLLEHASRFGLDFSASRWREDLAGGGEDELTLGDLNLVFRFANSARTAFRTGVGLNWLVDGSDEDFGFDFTYGAEWFVGRRLHLAAELDLGNLGEADLVHARASSGLILGRAMLTLAYDHTDIEGVDLDSLSLGLSAWF